MIDLYSWSTPNGMKISIMLEEVQLPYTVHPINIREDNQFSEHFVGMNPNSKIPVIVDHEGPDGKPLTVFESGAILVYLGHKTGKLLPTDLRQQMEVMQWLMFQMASVGPMFGQNHYFRAMEEPMERGIARFAKETERLYGVLNGRLADREYLCDQYSIADIATLPWVYRHPRQTIDLNQFPHVKRWYDALMARPAVATGIEKA